MYIVLDLQVETIFIIFVIITMWVHNVVTFRTGKVAGQCANGLCDLPLLFSSIPRYNLVCRLHAFRISAPKNLEFIVC